MYLGNHLRTFQYPLTISHSHTRVSVSTVDIHGYILCEDWLKAVSVVIVLLFTLEGLREVE
jgi:hypothetical protein